MQTQSACCVNDAATFSSIATNTAASDLTAPCVAGGQKGGSGGCVTATTSGGDGGGGVTATTTTSGGDGGGGVTASTTTSGGGGGGVTATTTTSGGGGGGSGRTVAGYELIAPDTFTPRDYQLELFEAAKLRNVVVALGTGSGKTFIAILLINELSAPIRKAWCDGGQRTFFLVNTVPLVSQQARSISHHTDLTVGQFSGSVELDCWNRRDWHRMFEKYQVLVMSSQIFLNILLHGFLTPDRINLLILDECHHAVKHHPMRLVMQVLANTREAHSCRVLGLSASVINRKLTPNQLHGAIHLLENSLGCSVLTSSHVLSVYKYCTRPVERVLVCDDAATSCRLHQQLSRLAHDCLLFLDQHRYNPVEVFGEDYREYLRDVPDPVTEPKHIITDFIFVLNTLGVWCADRCAFFLLVDVERLRRKTAYDRHFLLLGCVFSVLVQIRMLCARAFRDKSTVQLMEQYSTAKLSRLIATVLLFAPTPAPSSADDVITSDTHSPDGASVAPAGGGSGDRTFSGIVFVQQRITAKTLFHVLRELNETSEQFSFLRSQFVVGGSRNVYMDPKLRKKQEDVLRRFRSGDCNLVVSTSVLEEGVDVPRCNLVVRFDLPTEFRSYLQSKGRARALRSHYLLLATRSEAERFLNDLATYHVLEEMLLKRSAANCSDEPTLYDQLRVLAEHDIEPFRPAVSTGAQVTATSAISLINRYCAKLPSDNFTRLSPLWTMQCGRQRGDWRVLAKRCSLRMPINSPCKDTIQGDWMASGRLARQSAAVAMCRRLFQLAELDHHLLPVSKEALIEQEQWPDEEAGAGDIGGGRPGTARRRQYYDKPVSRFLKRHMSTTIEEDDCDSCADGAASTSTTASTSTATNDNNNKDDDGFHLYALRMRLQCPVPDDQNTRARDLFRPELETRSLALLTFNRLPKVCTFPVYTRSGEVAVDVQLLCTCVRVTPDQLQSLLEFHRYVFGQVLQLQKFLMTFKFVESECGYIVAPITRDTSSAADHIDWSFLNSVASRYNEKPRPLSDQQRATFVYEPQQFADAVVVPWYRNIDEPQCFYVARVLEDMTPESPFPDGSFDTFAAYYRAKYSVAIQNSRQPLLDVDHTSVRLNLLTPRYVNRKGVALPSAAVSTRRAKLQLLEEKQILVPELCHVHALSGALWRQLVALPTVLWRLNGLLLAEQLRQRVARAIGIGQVTPAYEWPPMTFGWTLADALRRRGPVQSALQPVGTASPPASHFDIGMWNSELATGASNNESQDCCATEQQQQQQQRRSDGQMEHEYEEDDDEDDDDVPLACVPLPPNVKVLTPAVSSLGAGAGTAGRTTGGAAQAAGWQVRCGSPDYLSGATSGAECSWPTGRAAGVASCGDCYCDCDGRDGGDDGDDVEEEELNNDCSHIADSSRSGLSPVVSSQTAAAAAADGAAGKVSRATVRSGYVAQTGAGADNDDDCDDDDDETVFDFFSDTVSLQQVRERMQRRVQQQRRRIAAQQLVSGESSDGQLLQLQLSPGSSVDTSAMSPVAAAGRSRSYHVSPVALTQPGGTARSLRWKHSTSAPNLVGTGRTERPPVSAAADSPPGGWWLGRDTCGADPAATPTPAVSEHLYDVTECAPLIEANPGGAIRPPESRVPPDAGSDRPLAGPSPALLLQALTTSSTGDGVNLERLETVGDSFLKFAVTAHLYLLYPSLHEGKLSYLRSKRVSNVNLFRLGSRRRLHQLMTACKFEPRDSWLPPGYVLPRTGAEQPAANSGVSPAAATGRPPVQQQQQQQPVSIDSDRLAAASAGQSPIIHHCSHTPERAAATTATAAEVDGGSGAGSGAGVSSPYVAASLLGQQCVADKSVADCAEALIGAYLLASGCRAALLFMCWLGLDVLPRVDGSDVARERPALRHHRRALSQPAVPALPGSPWALWQCPPSPLNQGLAAGQGPPAALVQPLLAGLDRFERVLGYCFSDKFYLLQALTHASYYCNTVTDCYQRLEFLGDAVLDYLITRHLYEDERNHDPGALTDLRSALVNNTMFATLAVRFGFHRFFRHYSHGLNQVIDRFLLAFGSCIDRRPDDEYLYIEETEGEDAEDVEIPKALGDLFESVAGAIYLDSGMSLDQVWRVYYPMMRKEIDEFSTSVPKSPIRELLEMEPEAAKFRKPERCVDGRIRVTVDIIGKQCFSGVGRNYRIAKCTAAKKALVALRRAKQQRQRAAH